MAAVAEVSQLAISEAAGSYPCSWARRGGSINRICHCPLLPNLPSHRMRTHNPALSEPTIAEIQGTAEPTASEAVVIPAATPPFDVL